MHHLNLKQRQIDHYHQISSLSPLIHTPIQDHATSCTDNRTTFSSQRVYISPSPINNSGITNPQPTTAYIFITRYQGRAKLDGCASAVSCSSVGGARAASPRHSAFCCERHTVSKWSFRLKYVLFPENRETNCLSTKVEPITEMLSKISNSNAYIRLNLGSYSM